MCVVYKGVGGEGGGGRAGGFSKPETQAAQPSGQELTETATVGLDHGIMARAEVDVGGPLVPQCHLINTQQ